MIHTNIPDDRNNNGLTLISETNYTVRLKFLKKMKIGIVNTGIMLLPSTLLTCFYLKNRMLSFIQGSKTCTCKSKMVKSHAILIFSNLFSD